MRFEHPPLAGRLVRRYQRFFADVELASGEHVTAHCPNTGSLLGCLASGAPVWLRDSHKPQRKLRYTWQAVQVGATWVNVDTALPNRIVSEALEAGLVPELSGYAARRREVPYGRSSRIDILLEDPSRARCFIEVKSTTLAEGSVALFPDAVTERGQKHLAELARVARRGERAVQFFLVSRADVRLFRPAEAIDPEYARALRRAVRAGVEVLAWTARVEPQGLELGAPLEIDLARPRTVVTRPQARAGSARKARSSRARPASERR